MFSPENAAPRLQSALPTSSAKSSRQVLSKAPPSGFSSSPAICPVTTEASDSAPLLSVEHRQKASRNQR